jgi:DNA-binding CsgD family transcriptional regulator
LDEETRVLAAFHKPMLGFLEDIPLPAIAIDSANRIAYVNAATRGLLGGAAASAIGASFLESLPAGERAGFVDRAAGWRNGTATVFRGVVIGPEKALVGVIGIPIVVRDESREFLGAVVLFLGVALLRDLLANYLERVRDNVSSILAQLVNEAREAHTAAEGYSPLARTRRNSKRLQSLSEREWEVVERVARGHRVLEIAKELGVALSTTRNHLKASYKKLGVKSQAELVALVLGGSGGPK